MSTKTLKSILFYASFAFIAIFVIAAVLFCIFPEQLWIIGILAGALVGFAGTRIPYDHCFKDKTK